MHREPVICGAAFAGHIDVLIWAFCVETFYTIHVSDNALVYAARGNKLAALKWLRARIVWSLRHTGVLIAAMNEGNFEMFEWAIKDGCPVDELRLLSAAADPDMCREWLARVCKQE